LTSRKYQFAIDAAPDREWQHGTLDGCPAAQEHGLVTSHVPARLDRRHFLAGAAAAFLAGCSGGPRSATGTSASPPAATTGPAQATAGRSRPEGTPSAAPAPSPAPPSVILARSHVPVLCFHQIRPWRADDPPSTRSLITPPDRLAGQMQTLASAGYTTITPDQLLNHLKFDVRLPERPVLLTFDDASEGQYTNALPILQDHAFTATFFVMTVVLDKPHWLSRTQVRDLDRRGMTIGAHTWDHHRVTGYTGADWWIQLTEPAHELTRIIGRPVRLFAYPNGAWNQAALPHVQAAGYEAAFQLGAPQDRSHPLLTIRRIMVASDWNGPTLVRQLNSAF
jgi:peptidoglycan/xylan/chitin deacetylase (PgdA/CDA1 family)